MENKEFKDAWVGINVEEMKARETFEGKRKTLCSEWMRANRRFHNGNVVETSYGAVFTVDECKFCRPGKNVNKGGNIPVLLYSGIQMTKSMKPRKDKGRTSEYDIPNRELKKIK
jgi:hypothetical protein